MPPSRQPHTESMETDIHQKRSVAGRAAIANWLQSQAFIRKRPPFVLTSKCRTKSTEPSTRTGIYSFSDKARRM